MKALILFFSLLIFSTSIIAQPVKNFQPYKIDYKKLNLKGKVARIDSELETVSGKSTSSYIFNHQGNLLFEIAMGDTINFYYYDDKGNLIRWVNNLGGTIFDHSFEVDENNNLSKDCVNGVCYNFIWEENRLIDEGGQFHFNFDKSGMLISKEEYGEAIEYKYNSKKQVTKITKYNLDDEEENEIYTYNKNNDVVLIKYVNDYYPYETKSSYEYDKQGNWIKRNTVVMASPENEKRTITYFKDVPAAKTGKKK